MLVQKRSLGRDIGRLKFLYIENDESGGGRRDAMSDSRTFEVINKCTIPCGGDGYLQGQTDQNMNWNLHAQGAQSATHSVAKMKTCKW